MFTMPIFTNKKGEPDWCPKLNNSSLNLSNYRNDQRCFFNSIASIVRAKQIPGITEDQIEKNIQKTAERLNKEPEIIRSFVDECSEENTSSSGHSIEKE